MTTSGRRWRTADDVRAAVRRRWDDGSLLRAHARGEAFSPIEVPLGGPRATEIGARLAEVQDWVAALESGGRDGARYTLQYKDVGGRAVGRNRLPARAVVSEFSQAWALLGVRADVAAYDRMLGSVAAFECGTAADRDSASERDAASDPGAAVREWLLRSPVTGLRFADEWPQVLAAYRWLASARGSGRYLRQIDAPGVDTKFVESHRGVLADLLAVSRSAGGFLRDLGLRGKPEYVRFRLAPGVLDLPVSELSVRSEELPGLDPGIRSAVIVENEITYLTVPVPRGGVVIWGSGFDVARLGRWPALRECPVHYWGDLDTHGFAILHRLRAHLPDVRSALMDAETLLAHRERWGTEPSPTHAGLSELTPEESAVYDDLVTDRYGERVRLEQERIDWAWVLDRLPYEFADSAG